MWLQYFLFLHISYVMRKWKKTNKNTFEIQDTFKTYLITSAQKVTTVINLVVLTSTP